MFRFLRSIIFFALGIALAFCAIVLARVPITEYLLSQKLGNKVKLSSMKIGWREISLHNFQLLNPKSINRAFTAESISLSINPLRRRVEELKVTNPILHLELYNASGTNNNWSTILNRYPTLKGTKHFTIHKLTLINPSFHIQRSNGKELALTLPQITFDKLDLSPLALSDISKVIFEQMLYSITSKQHLGAILDNVETLPFEFITRKHKRLNEAKALIKESFETIKRKTQEGADLLFDFFSLKSEE